MLRLIEKADDRVVIWGMSCSGKTTMATLMKDHHYYCFDALFQWHTVESLAFSCRDNLRYIRDICLAPRFVLDGWHLSDSSGELLPRGVSVYVVYAYYDKIIDQYRTEISFRDQHRHMFDKWYVDVDFDQLPNVRYFRNDGNFIETDEGEFKNTINS